MYRDCETLTSDYIDFIIPQEIQGLDKLYPESSAVDIFRNWFKKIIYEQIRNKASIDKDFKKRYEEIIERYYNGIYINNLIEKLDFEVNNEIMISRYNSFIVEKFKNYKDENGEHIVKKLNLEYKLVRKRQSNSGTQKIETISDVEREVENVIRERNTLCLPQYYGEQLYELSIFSYCYNKDEQYIKGRIEKFYKKQNDYKNIIKNFGGIDEMRTFWEKHYLLSQRAYNIMKKYDISNKNFSVKELEKYNLLCCANCHKKLMKGENLNAN